MPEYLAPGVYVEEVSFRSKSIEGVSTSTAGFVGATRFGPVDGEPELITSFNQFERIYGGLDQLAYVPEDNFGATPSRIHNYLAQAVRAFFDNGGQRLYIARTFRSFARVNQILTSSGQPPVAVPAALNADGVAAAIIPAPASQIVDASTAAGAAATAARNAIIAAGQAANEAQAGAIAALTAALTQVDEALPGGTPLPVIDTAADAAPDIIADIQAVIDGMPAGAEKDAAQAALTAATPTINNAVAARIAAAAAVASVAAAPAQGYMTAVSEGTADGNNPATPLPAGATPADVAATAATAAETAADTADTETDQTNTERGDLSEALGELGAATTANRIARADAVVTAANDAVAAVTAVDGSLAAANAAEAAATAAARSAAIAMRAANGASVGSFSARFPGVAGNMRVIVTARLGQNVLSENSSGDPSVSQIKQNDLVLLTIGAAHSLRIAENVGGNWRFASDSATTDLSTLNPAGGDQARIVTFTVEIRQPGAFAQPLVWANLTVHSDRMQDGITHVFAAEISNRAQYLETPLVLDNDGTAVELAAALMGNTGLTDLPDSGSDGVQNVITLSGGSDGVRPTSQEYIGTGGDDLVKSGLVAFEDLEEIAIVAAPGVSFDASTTYASEYRRANDALIAHCERMRYRVAVLDSPNNQALSQVRNTRAVLDTTRAAFYYPWIRVMDPITRQPIHVPPSGFVSGIYARNDVDNGVHKAPANEVLLGALGLETLLNKAQQDVLNPIGINCVRYFEGRGIRVWGARTVSSDPEWKYLNIRRYFAYLEHSIERSTQWAVFEPNGEALWSNVRRAVEDFLYNEWKSERLAGSKPNEAYFVRCDRSTMTQNDLDNGRMICLIGVAPLYPAEFVIFRIGQWTADRAS